MSSIILEKNVVIHRQAAFEDNDIYVYEVPKYDKYVCNPNLRISDTVNSVTIYGIFELEKLAEAIEITLLEWNEEKTKRKLEEEKINDDTE